MLQFLDDLQLRYLFTVLASAFLALASLCVDLADPFRGSFTITPSTSQLECIRQYIRGDCASDEANVAAARARNREIDLAAAGRSATAVNGRGGGIAGVLQALRGGRSRE